MEFGKTSSCVYKIRYHIVIIVKYRKALLNPGVEQCIRETITGIAERYEFVFDELGFDQNHVHIFCGAKPTIAPMSIVAIVKSITARQVFKTFPKLKREELWGGEFWSDGKYIGTVGEQQTEDIVKRYIQNQSLDKKEVNRRTSQLRLFKL